MIRWWPSMLVLLSLVPACPMTRMPPPAPLRGWEPMPTAKDGLQEYVRGRAVIQDLLPLDPSVDLGDPETLRAHIAVVPPESLELGDVRRRGRVSWVDGRYVREGIPQRVRLAWFVTATAIRAFRLTGPEDTWTSPNVSAFQNHVREIADAEPES